MTTLLLALVWTFGQPLPPRANDFVLLQGRAGSVKTGMTSEEATLEATSQLQDVLAAKWRDGEIRTEVIPSTGETDISLGLLPSGPHGTVTLVLSARLQRRVPPDPPGTLQVLMGAGLNVNPNAIRRPVLRFVLNPESPEPTIIDASDRVRVLDPDPSASLDNVSATITLVEFIQLLRADEIAGQILGLDVSFTSQERNALREFGLQVLRQTR